VSFGFFGGSFDPPHFGHIEMAKSAIDFFDLDVLNVCPTSIPFSKKQPSSQKYANRLHMARIAFAGIDNLRVVDWERGGNESYTIETLQSLRKRVGDKPEVYLVMGIDSFLGITGWKQFELLFTMSKFVVFLRGEKGIEVFNEMIDKLAKSFIFTDNIICMHNKIPDISSSEIREKIIKKESVNDMLPKDVEKLYKSYVGIS